MPKRVVSVLKIPGCFFFLIPFFWFGQGLEENGGAAAKNEECERVEKACQSDTTGMRGFFSYYAETADGPSCANAGRAIRQVGCVGP